MCRQIVQHKKLCLNTHLLIENQIQEEQTTPKVY